MKKLKNDISYLKNIDNLIKQILVLYEGGLIDEEFKNQQIKDLRLKVTSLETSLGKVNRGLKNWKVMTEREKIIFASKYIQYIQVDFINKEVAKVEFVELGTNIVDNLKK